MVRKKSLRSQLYRGARDLGNVEAVKHGGVEGLAKRDAPEPVKAFETRAQDFFCASLSMVGLLIHAAVGSLGGLGFRLPNRQGLTA